ncbi:MAG: hypothetical protein V1856_01315 [Candidatus Liptonbacteria bacterium]
MNQETKQCQNCKSNFTIEPEDVRFYERINVPSPTFCPDCRAAMRMVWRNEHTYYHRKCNAPKHTESIISLFPPEAPYNVYDQQYWWSDDWDALSYGKEYDFQKPFFEQYRELLSRVPLISLSNTGSVNSDYCSSAAWNKDCYLVSGSGWDERVSYANRAIKNKDSMDLYIVNDSELCYDDMYCASCYEVLHSQSCEGCSSSAFLYNCRNCRNCFGCANLRGAGYCIWNKQYSKEEYESKIKELNLGSREALAGIKKKFYEEIYLKAIHKYGDIVNCTNSTGDHLKNTKNCRDCFDFGGDNAENCRFVNWSGFNTKDLYDTGPGAGWGSELLYQGVDINDSSRIIGGITVYNSSDAYYVIQNHASNNVFGCYGMRNKQFCILNKQYTKEEYEELLPKIKKHMVDMPYIDGAGRKYFFGDFFPPDLAIFPYNDTVAQEYLPKDKGSSVGSGFRWRDPDAKSYSITIRQQDVPDQIMLVSDSILQEVIECEHKGLCADQCSTAFKIIPQELQLYKQLNIPIPTLCPNCRHYERLKKRTPMKLWSRKCECTGARSENGIYQNTAAHQHGAGPCQNEFQTSYSPDRPEIVYCESCYQAEIV